MNFFIFLVLFIVALFIWIQPPKKKVIDESPPTPEPKREIKLLPLDPIHLWEAEPALSFALNGRVQQCSDCKVIRLHPCQCEAPLAGSFNYPESTFRANRQLPKGSKFPHWDGEDCNKRYKIDRYGGTLSSLQELRKHWISLGHKNVPDPKCCCGYDGPGLNYYRDRNGDKIFCSLHPNVK